MKINPRFYDVIMCVNWNLKHKLFNILRNKGLLMKLGQFTEKIYRKCASETGTTPLLDFGE